MVDRHPDLLQHMATEGLDFKDHNAKQSEKVLESLERGNKQLQLPWTLM